MMLYYAFRVRRWGDFAPGLGGRCTPDSEGGGRRMSRAGYMYICIHVSMYA